MTASRSKVPKDGHCRFVMCAQHGAGAWKKGPFELTVTGGLEPAKSCELARVFDYRTGLVVLSWRQPIRDC